jgi:hypothetical protein
VFVVAADAFAAVIGLPDQIAERDAVAIQVLPDARGEHGAGGGTGLTFGKGPEEQSAADCAGVKRSSWWNAISGTVWIRCCSR